MRLALSSLLALVVALLVAMPAAAQALYAGNTIAYQGRLENGGVPVTDMVSMTFRFYPTATSTTELGSFTTDVTPADGVFGVDIGPLPDAVFASAELYLSVEVNGTLLGARQRVIAAPRAARADTAGELTVTGTAVVVGNTVSNDLEVGNMGHNGWAGAGHTDAAGPNGYALLQNADASQTLINAANGGTVRIRTGNTDRVVVDSDGNLDVSGETKLGYVRRSCAYPSGQGHGDCSCEPGERVISGGTYTEPPATSGTTTVYSLRESRPIDDDTWRVACVADVAAFSFSHLHARSAIDCGRIDIICARVGN